MYLKHAATEYWADREFQLATTGYELTIGTMLSSSGKIVGNPETRGKAANIGISFKNKLMEVSKDSYQEGPESFHRANVDALIR